MKKTNKIQKLNTIRKCKHCKKEFYPFYRRPNQRFCSDKCNLAAYRISHKKQRIAYTKKYQKKNKEKINEKSRQWRLKNLEKRQAYEREYYQKNYQRDKKTSIKNCEICKQEYVDKTSNQIKKYCSNKCRNKSYLPKSREYQKEWRNQNPEKYKLQLQKGYEYKRRRYHDDKKYRENLLQKHRGHYWENRYEVLAKHREYFKKYSKTEKYKKHRRGYYRENKERFADYQRENYKNKIKKLGGKCSICRSDEALNLHHIIPKAEGGSNKLENLAVLCANHHMMIHRGMITL